MDKVYSIRNYSKQDEPKLREICFDSGRRGDSIKPVFSDFKLFTDFWIAPYLEIEPEHTLVATCGKEVVGYLTGAFNPYFERKQFFSMSLTALNMARKVLSGEYNSNPETVNYVGGLFFRAFMENPKHPKTPAHFHMNLHKEHRGLGLGRRLFFSFEEMLIANSIPQVYAVGISSPKRENEYFFRKLGFGLFNEVPVTWLDNQPGLKAVCFHKKYKS